MAVVSAPKERADWPRALVADATGLTFDGCSVRAVAADVGTPFWMISRRMVEENYSRFLTAFRSRYPTVDVAYSMKANNTLALLRILHRLGAKMDCTGESELRLALMSGLPPENIILNGNGKSDDTLRAAATLGVLQVNLDSMAEAQRLDAIAAEIGRPVDCTVRVQLTYERLLEKDRSFEPVLRIGEGKFGANLASGEAMRVVQYVVSAEHLRFVGLHHHVGFSGYMSDYSPEKEVMHHRECTTELCEFAKALTAALGVRCERLDLGGGFRGGSWLYLATPGQADDGAFHAVPNLEDYVDAIISPITKAFRRYQPALQFETGGYQVANAIVFVAQVVEVKPAHGAPVRDYVTIDGSMQMFTSKGTMRVASQVVVVDRPDLKATGRLSEIVGQTCVYDSVAEDVSMPAVSPGDLIVLLNHGAYTETSGTQMNAFPRPASVLCHQGKATVVRRRETTADLAARNSIPIELWDELA